MNCCFPLGPLYFYCAIKHWPPDVRRRMWCETMILIVIGVHIVQRYTHWPVTNDEKSFILSICAQGFPILNLLHPEQQIVALKFRICVTISRRSHISYLSVSTIQFISIATLRVSVSIFVYAPPLTSAKMAVVYRASTFALIFLVLRARIAWFARYTK